MSCIHKISLRSLISRIVLPVMLSLWFTGCAFKVVRPETILVKVPETGETEIIEYPAYVITHDSDSPWDAHQIKNNIVGFLDLEIVRILDITIDLLIPFREQRPIENSIELVKNSYAQIPDCIPVRVIGGFFRALGIEKLCISRASFYFFPRLVYLTDWVQETLGEVNIAAGYIAPWRGAFVPKTATKPLNDGVDWAQSSAIGIYIRILHQLNSFADHVIDSGESAWAGIIRLFIRQ